MTPYGPRRLIIGVRPIGPFGSSGIKAQAYASVGGGDIVRVEDWSPEEAKAKIRQCAKELWDGMGGPEAATERVRIRSELCELLGSVNDKSLVPGLEFVLHLLGDPSWPRRKR